ncbi:DUF427 domain-containing protein [Cypionkella sp.]|uniref:DUF427 domain-containing protein n=1 Tax=Cypionkella sp. TaxID=2811411 RepID=UPI002ABA3F06|nr:DUF427 domain-containing protein [Cypionkella sp.]MDZ4395317.1 DUF427 domain-containing protein [Cypionkella sp.]
MDYITITRLERRLNITAGETRLGETQAALELKEGSYPPVLYVPRADVDMSLLVKTAHQTTCPHKGLCSYYSVKTPQGLLENAVWSYEAPIPGMERIASHLAFYPDKVTLSDASWR